MWFFSTFNKKLKKIWYVPHTASIHGWQVDTSFFFDRATAGKSKRKRRFSWRSRASRRIWLALKNRQRKPQSTTITSQIPWSWSTSPGKRQNQRRLLQKKRLGFFQRILTILFMCFLQSRDSISATSLPEHALSLSRCLFDMFHGYLPGKNYNGVECWLLRCLDSQQSSPKSYDDKINQLVFQIIRINHMYSTIHYVKVDPNTKHINIMIHDTMNSRRKMHARQCECERKAKSAKWHFKIGKTNQPAMTSSTGRTQRTQPPTPPEL